jgi:hypothetical protein
VYVKIFGSILDSSVWDESAETRLVWITMLLMADEHGFVRGTPASLARRAVVGREQAEDALRVLEAPDPRSHTTDHEGRRIEAADGGWVVLNYAKYREYRTRKQVKDAEKKRRQRQGGGTCPPCPPLSPPIASASASESFVVVVNEVSQKLTPEARRVYEARPANEAMDAVLAECAKSRGWGDVSRTLVEMAAADARWSPAAVRGFLRKLPVTASRGNLPVQRWCAKCDGPEMREGPNGRLIAHHLEGCPNA